MTTVVAAALTGRKCMYDNPKTQEREFWAAGGITFRRKREFCSGAAEDWGTYSKPRVYD